MSEHGPADLAPAAQERAAGLWRGPRPLSTRVSDAALVSYALWTATCHAVMFARGSLYTLGIASSCVLVAGTLLALALRRRNRHAAAERLPAEQAATAPPLDRRTTLVLAGLCLATMLAWLLTGKPAVFWLASVLYLLIATGLALRSVPERDDGVVVERWQEISLWLLAIGSAVLSLAAHRWRNDDCYYVNLAVALVDHPKAALLSLNTIHAPPPGAVVPDNVFAPYRVHSFEALGGFLAHLFGLEPISVMHLGLCAGFASLVPLAAARLFQRIDRERWFWMVLAAMCLQLFDGSAGLGFANQGIVRMFTGKSVLITVALPLLVTYGIGFGLAPSLRRFALLLAAQVACVGFSSTGLWLAPVVAMLAVAVALEWKPSAWRTLLFALASCAYVLALALWVRAKMGGGLEHGGAEDVAGAAAAVQRTTLQARYGLVYYWLKLTFEQPRAIHAYLGLLLLAIPASRTALARRYIVAFTCLLTVLCLNPYLTEVIRGSVTGKFTGQRVLWIAPLPAALAIVATCMLPATTAALRTRVLALSACVVGLVLFFTIVPTQGVFTKENDVRFHWPPGPKVPADAWQAAKWVTRELPRGSIVLAPEVVSWYLPTLRQHAFPLLANAKYISASPAEEQRRIALVKRVSAHDGDFTEREQEELRDALDHYHVAAVILSRQALKTRGLVSTLRHASFASAPDGVKGFQVWLRRTAAL